MSDALRSTLAPQTSRPCPHCGATLPVNPEYVTWCDHCDWNLQPSKSEQRPTLFDRYYTMLGRQFSKGLFDSLVQRGPHRPRLDAPVLLAYALALAVHGLTLYLLYMSLSLVAQGTDHPFWLLLGFFGLGVVWVLRPRIPHFTDFSDIVTRAEFPTLFRIIDEITTILHGKSIDTVLINEEFNAYFGRYGWQWQRLLGLGLPLLTILEPQERIAVLSHELAHGVNGDPARGFVMRTTLSTLIEWYNFLHPGNVFGGADLYSLAAVPFNLILLALALTARLLIYSLLHLFWRNSQRAEYLADALAAQVAGTAAACTALDKLHYAPAFTLTLRRVALAATEQNLFTALREQVTALPAHELARMRRIEEVAGSRIDVTHPPTTYRMALMRAHPLATPQYTLSATDAAQLDAELATVQRRVQEQLLDRR